MAGLAGTKYTAEDAQINDAGDVIRVYAMHIISGGTAGIVSLKNGGASGTVYITEDGSANVGETFVYGTHGVLFPDGCYIDVDANTTSVVVAYRKER